MAIPNLQGAWGTPVPVVQPYASNAPPSAMRAHAMLADSMPLNMVQMNNTYAPGSSGIVPTGGTANPGAAAGPPGATPPSLMAPPGGMLSPPGMPFAPGMPPPGCGPMGCGPGGCGPMVPFGMGVPGMPGAGGMPPSMAGVPNGAMLPYQMPGPGGPAGPFAGAPPAGAVAAVGALTSQGQLRFPTHRTQVRFVSPSGMKVYWYTCTADGKDGYSETPIETPGRYNFLQAAVYRLKLTNIPGSPGMEIYPTLEVVPANPHTEAFLAHSAVPVSFSADDFKQIAAGNYIVKVIYLPSPENQDLAFAGPGEIVSTQLAPGADPIREAMRLGYILLVIRMGNMDQEAPNTPPINAPGARYCPPQMPGGMMGPGGPVGFSPPGPMTPYSAMGRPPMMPGMMPPGLMPGMVPPGMPGQPGASPYLPGQPGAAPGGQLPVPPGGGSPAAPGATPPAPPAGGPIGQLSGPSGLQLTSAQLPAAPAQRTNSTPTGNWFQLPFVGSPGQSCSTGTCANGQGCSH
jgi:hypothetical protein